MTEKRVAEVEAVPHPAFDEFVATIEALRELLHMDGGDA